MEGECGIAHGSTAILGWAHRFQDIVENGDINTKLKPRFNLKVASDGIKFKSFIYD